MSRFPRLTSTVLFFCLTACVLAQVSEPEAIPTPTTVRVIQVTPVPTLERAVQAVATPLLEETPEPGLIRCPADVDAPATRYVIQADVDFPSKMVNVEQTTAYVNRTETSLDHLIFVIRPNNLPQVFTLAGVTLGGQQANYDLTGQRLMVELPDKLDPGCELQAVLRFELRIPEIVRANPNAYKGYLGYSSRQINLGHWTPTIAVRQGDDWLLHDETPIGEQDVLDEADWDVTINVLNPPEDLHVAAPGTIETNKPGHYRYLLPRARDFSLSISPDYTLTTQETDGGVTVELYTFDDALIQTEAGAINSPAFALDVASKSLNMYSDLYGPFPYERMVVIQSDFPDGMEFSGLVFVGGEYFRGFGGPTSYLMLITIHEIAHQWWYNQVGSDQALNPWLDEALATYSEYAFIEEYFPALREWWWSFRVDNFSPEGFVDSTVYEFRTRREYINAVYLRGVRMLRDLRNDLGTDAFFDWLRRYAEAGAGKVVTPDFFWSLLTPEQLAGTARTRQKYLKQPQIIVIAPTN